MNTNLFNLYSELATLNKDIGLACQECIYPCCVGYVWLLSDEAKLLVDIGVQVVEINDSATFIHSFEEEDGALRIDKPKPPCPWRDSGYCSIYENRPLVCRMYPVGLATDNDAVVLALHKDCQYSRGLKGQNKKKFVNRIIEIIRKTPVDLLNEIFGCYQRVHWLSKSPEGPNAFEVIAPLKDILNGRR